MRHIDHDENRRHRRWWFRARALLAGGLVLGIGAAVTVAAWNDSEYVDTTITAGTFQIEGSTTSATAGYADHAVSTTSTTLSFSSPVTAITPGTTTYASFWVRTKATSVAGTVALQTPTFGATPLGTTIVATGTTLNATLTAPSPVISAAGGGVHQYCFAITLPTTADNTVQGLNAIPTWQFLATAS